MNNKLIELFKKLMTFIKNNWIAIVVIVFLLFFNGVCSKIADNQIKKLNEQIAVHKAKVADLMKEIDLIISKFKDLEKEKNSLFEKNAELECQLKDLIAVSSEIQKKYEELRKKIDQMSSEDKDKQLIRVLKDYDITVEIKGDYMMITFNNRGKLLNILIDLREAKEKLLSQSNEISNYRATLEVKDKIIVVLNKELILKVEETKKLYDIVKEKDGIIKNMDKKLFWKNISKKIIPSLIVGLSLGYIIGH